MSAASILKNRYPSEVVDVVLSAYREIESNYVMKKWKASELDAGHFVEGVRRILEFELFQRATPVSQQLPTFTDQVLKGYENTKGDDSFRMLIPRALKAVYNIRNKRGVGHLGAVSPNQMDATYILYSVKWVLAELVRLSSGLSTGDTQKVVDGIVERRVEVLWKHEDVTRVLAPFKAKEQVLVLLYDQSPQTEEALREVVEYKNPRNFRVILKDLHKRRLIHYENTRCLLTPKGLVESERLLSSISGAP